MLDSRITGLNCRPVRRAVRGFTILELLMVMGIVTVLLSLVLPAVGSAREAARRLECVNQLKQVGLALHQYHDVHQSFPPGWQWEETHQSGWSWTVSILPFLEQTAVYRLIDRDQPVFHESNAKAREQTLPFLLCPSDITEPRFVLYSEPRGLTPAAALTELPTASYFGVFGITEPDESHLPPGHPGEGTFIESRSIRISELTQGSSNTVIVGERTMARIPSTWLGVDWRGEDAACRLVGNTDTSPNCRQCDECEFGSRHSGGANFLYGDGHVKLVSENIDRDLYQKLGRRSECSGGSEF
ncbi:MAG: DUF1559 domain-containing protein [Planctomycetaceae bacterium]|nr:DUF1559 domain-containing protein [Planctomycetaceae bacterium]